MRGAGEPGRAVARSRGRPVARARRLGGGAARRLRGRLGGDAGLLALLAGFEAFSDPLQKKAFLFAKLCDRRGWLTVRDPEHWQVCADNVLMRLALRSGLVAPGSRDDVRAATRDALRASPTRPRSRRPSSTTCCGSSAAPIPTCSATDAGDLREPERDPDSLWY